MPETIFIKVETPTGDVEYEALLLSAHEDPVVRFSFGPFIYNIDKKIFDVPTKLSELENDVGYITSGGVTLATFQKTLGSALNYLIPATEHELSFVNGVTVLTPSRAEIDVYVELRANQDVYIESNINLLNHILKIF